jgi:hypothetical protein
MSWHAPSIKIEICVEWSYGFCAVGYGEVVEGRPVRMRRLPCCGLGLGWCLWVSLFAPAHLFVNVKVNSITNNSISLPGTRFITGFFLAAIPWYVGAFIMICVRVHDQREKPGYVACTIAVSSFLLIQCIWLFISYGIWNWAAWYLNKLLIIIFVAITDMKT